MAPNTLEATAVTSSEPDTKVYLTVRTNRHGALLTMAAPAWELDRICTAFAAQTSTVPSRRPLEPAPYRQARTFDLAPLLARSGLSIHGLSRTVRASGRTIKQALTEGLTVSQADRWAARCGFAMREIW